MREFSGSGEQACSGGKTEVYTEAEADQEPPSCGGFSAGAGCTMGDCP